MEDFFLIAEIVSVFNTEGYLRIKSFSDFPERFFYLDKVFINIFGDYREFIVENVEQFDKDFILKFENFDSENDVEFLVGSAVFVDENNSVKLDEDTYFIHDLVGCTVTFNKKFFGKIVDVLSLASNDVYVVLDEDNKERLIPAISGLIASVNVEAKKIELKMDFDEFGDDEN